MATYTKSQLTALKACLDKIKTLNESSYPKRDEYTLCIELDVTNLLKDFSDVLSIFTPFSLLWTPEDGGWTHGVLFTPYLAQDLNKKTDNNIIEDHLEIFYVQNGEI